MQEEINTREEAIKFIDETNEIIWNIRGVRPRPGFNPKEAGDLAVQLAQKFEYKSGLGRALLNQGMGAFIILNNLNLSLSSIDQSMEIFKEINDQKWIANAQLTLAIIHNTSSHHEQALYFGLRGIDYYKTVEKEGTDFIMGNYILGTIYKDLKKYREAETYYLEGIKDRAIVDDKGAWGGRIFSGLSNIYNEEGRFDEAINFGMKALEVLKKEGNEIGESRALTDVGVILKKQKKYEEALDYLFRGLKIRRESNLKQFEIGSLNEISSIYRQLNEPLKAIEFLVAAAAITKEVVQPAKEANTYREISSIYKSIGNHEEALKYLELFISITLELNSKERTAKIEKLESALLLEKEQEIERLRNVELKNAYELITEKNKEITDSIQYAKRIQKTLMAADSILEQNLGEHFVFYKPKDIVSGDFYWATYVAQNSSKASIENSLNSLSNDEQSLNQLELFYLAVCDSTGHGVPGAFMSLLNITFLNEAITEKKIRQPHEVFNHVRRRLIETISQEGGKDGMDGILLCINKTTGTLSYSAANNPPVLISNGSLKDLSCDKMPVGKGEVDKPFDLKEVNFKPGDILYLSTDGFADQFGGPKGKKFKNKQLNELLLSVSTKPLNQQSAQLNEAFENWRGTLEQVDDVLIVGIRL